MRWSCWHRASAANASTVNLLDKGSHDLACPCASAGLATRNTYAAGLVCRVQRSLYWQCKRSPRGLQMSGQPMGQPQPTGASRKRPQRPHNDAARRSARWRAVEVDDGVDHVVLFYKPQGLFKSRTSRYQALARTWDDPRIRQALKLEDNVQACACGMVLDKLPYWDFASRHV